MRQEGGVARMRCTHSGDGIYAMASKARRAGLYEFDNAMYVAIFLKITPALK